MSAFLKENGGENIMVTAGGVIPPKDYDFLYEHGVSLIFGPGTPITDAASKMLDYLEEKEAY